jgi:hypothetical protein
MTPPDLKWITSVLLFTICLPSTAQTEKDLIGTWVESKREYVIDSGPIIQILEEVNEEDKVIFKLIFYSNGKGDSDGVDFRYNLDGKNLVMNNNKFIVEKITKKQLILVSQEEDERDRVRIYYDRK